VSSASSSRTRIANPRALKIGPEALTTFGPDDPSHDATAHCGRGRQFHAPPVDEDSGGSHPARGNGTSSNDADGQLESVGVTPLAPTIRTNALPAFSSSGPEPNASDQP